MATLLIVCFCVIFYTYLGYGLLLYLVVKIRGKSAVPLTPHELPTITVVIAAYNEEAVIEEKIINTLGLEYPADKIRYLCITDGSADHTNLIISRYPPVQLLHEPKRAGKAAAINRAMQQVRSAIVVFSDANTMINPGALQQMAAHFGDHRVGAVAGEKRVSTDRNEGAAGIESLYWQLESKLKWYESQFCSVMGVAGELFALRTSLFRVIPEESLLDDLAVSFDVLYSGSVIRYEPLAFATEMPSPDTKEERKRKLRMAAGALQIFVRHLRMLVPRQPLITFQYISHRILRWLVTPYLLILAFVLNFLLIGDQALPLLLQLSFYIQVLWYLLALGGWILDNYGRRAILFSVPYYFCLMNYCMIAGMMRYILGLQPVTWERAKRNVRG